MMKNTRATSTKANIITNTPAVTPTDMAIMLFAGHKKYTFD